MSKTRRLELRLVNSAPLEPPGPAAGRVVHDSRGNAVWNWDLDTGVFAQTTTADLLKCLEEPRLLLEDGESDSDWAGDPYNRSAG